jgi:hypothetical protein
METEGSLELSQDPSTGPYPEADTVHTIPSCLSKMHFNIIHPSTSWYSHWSLSFWLSTQISYMHSSSPPFVLHILPSHPSWLDHSTYNLRRVQVMKLLDYKSLRNKCSLHCWDIAWHQRGVTLAVSDKVQFWERKWRQCKTWDVFLSASGRSQSRDDITLAQYYVLDRAGECWLWRA